MCVCVCVCVCVCLLFLYIHLYNPHEEFLICNVWEWKYVMGYCKSSSILTYINTISLKFHKSFCVKNEVWKKPFLNDSPMKILICEYEKLIFYMTSCS